MRAQRAGMTGAAVVLGRRSLPSMSLFRSGEDLANLKVVIFLAAHIPLALAMARTPAIATAHALTVFAVGSWWAVGGRRLDRIIAVVGYLAGAEVLWRMTDAQVNWEFGKYAAAAILLLALVRHRRMKPPMLPLLYFVMLLPSVALTLANEDLGTARDQISFNLSGPFALMVCAWFFSGLRLTIKDLRTLFLAVIGPALGVAALAAYGTFSTSDIFFSDNSNYVTSGGFGPNQVSATLGLGALLALYVALDSNASRTLRFLMGGTVLALATQSALTFSRGGMYMAAGGAAIGACFGLRDARLRSRLVPFAVVTFLVGNYFVVPYLDAFTGGELSARFEDIRTTGRNQMIQADIELWKANPMLGVGPGEARTYRGTFAGITESGSTELKGAAAHTEFSRLLAEHGTLGLFALLLLVTAGFVNVRRAPDARMRALVAGLTTWSALFMFSAAMRLLAPSLTFAIGFAALIPDGDFQGKTQARGRGRLPDGSVPARPLTVGHPALGVARPRQLTT